MQPLKPLSLTLSGALVSALLAIGSAAAQPPPPSSPTMGVNPPTMPMPPTVSEPPASPNALPPPPVVPAPAAVQPPAAKPAFIEFTTLRLLHDRGIISQAEFDSAMSDLLTSLGQRAGESMTLVVGKAAITLYGFAQADVMWFSTQSFNDYAGNLQVARPGTWAGDHGRMEWTARDSRFGLRLAAPELSWMRASALLEMDFLGPSGTIGSTTTEGSFFNNPLMRIRHAYLKIETKFVDILFGHTWHLFGWQPQYVPADVQWSGVVGSLFSRSMQLRISKTVKTKPVTLDFAIAGMRPPQRDSMVPEFEAGARISFNKWTGVHTLYVTSTTTMPASIGISGDLRHYSLPEFSANPMSTVGKTGLAVAVDAFLPIIPGTKENRDNSLSIVGEFVQGQGINDLYVGLSGGVASPALPPAMPGGTAPTYNGDVDAGLAVYDINGGLRLPTWRTFIVGIEYYLPKVGGRIGLFANVARAQLLNSDQYVNPAKVRDNEIMYNGGLFADLSQAIRIGADYAYYVDTYADGVAAPNHAVQFTGFFFF